MNDLEQPVSPDSSVAENQSAALENHSPAADEQDESGINDQAENGDGQQAEESEDVEIDGEKFALPKTKAEKLKAERMMHADYTQKTQKIAERGRELETQAQQNEQRFKDQQQFIKDHARVEALNDQLAKYDALDWNTLIQQDPQQALIYQQQQREIERQRNEAQESVAQKQQQFALNEQQELAKRVQEAKAYVEREIPNWDSGRDSQLQAYAAGLGLESTELGKYAIRNPAIFAVLHKAEMYDRLSKAAPKQTQQAAPAAKPVPRVGTNSSVQKDPGKMSDKEFAAWRKSQIRNRN